MGIRDYMTPASKEIFRRIGEPGTYQAPSAPSLVDSYFIVSEGAEVLGDIGQVVARRDEMSILTEDIPAPLKEGLVNCGPEGAKKNWRLKEKLYRDGYYERWVVKNE